MSIKIADDKGHSMLPNLSFTVRNGGNLVQALPWEGGNILFIDHPKGENIDSSSENSKIQERPFDSGEVVATPTTPRLQDEKTI